MGDRLGLASIWCFTINVFLGVQATHYMCASEASQPMAFELCGDNLLDGLCFLAQGTLCMISKRIKTF